MHFVFRSFLYASVFAVLTLFACSNNPDGTCSSDTDCGEKKCCKEKGKETGECKDKCEAAPACKNDPCKTDADCLNSAPKCEKGCCTKVEAPKSCKKDGDCPSGNVCSSEKCEKCTQDCTSSTECSGSDTCDNGCCKQRPCKEDKECSSGKKKYCDKTTSKCVECTDIAQCGDKEACKSGSCRPVACTDDTHCPTQKQPICDLKKYVCIARKVCENSDDCKRLFPGGVRSRCDPSANGGLGECKKGHCVPCTKDDECGGSGDLCIGKEKGLKDGPRCLISCKESKDCPDGFDCSGTILQGFKVCYPRSGGYCVDPCTNVQCKTNEKCVEGKCIKQPEPCDSCTSDDQCGTGNKCLSYSGGKFCGKKCADASECPTNRKYLCLNGQCLAEDECK